MAGVCHAAIDRRELNLAPSPSSNGDYLRAVKAPDEGETLNAHVFNKGISDELVLRYNQMQGDYETSKNYGLNSMDVELRYLDANKSIGNWAVHKILDDDIRSPMRKYLWHELRDTIRHHDDDRPIAHSESGTRAASASGASGASGGESAPRAATAAKPASSTFFLKTVYGSLEHFYNNGLMLDSTTLMRFQYDIPSGVVDLKFTGGIIDTSFDYFVTPINLNSGGLGNATANPEHAAVSMNRGFRELGLSTGMHYGMMTRTLNAGMNKHLIGPLEAVVSQTVGLADASQTETTCRLNMGLKF